ncbi:hypothetical protein QJS66_04915 [Kocuria rhizophila]|nr:hypothetical protein QJS66_04915 [Kocuria rhizophila]
MGARAAVPSGSSEPGTQDHSCRRPWWVLAVTLAGSRAGGGVRVARPGPGTLRVERRARHHSGTHAARRPPGSPRTASAARPRPPRTSPGVRAARGRNGVPAW